MSDFKEFFNLFKDNLLQSKSETRLKEIFDMMDIQGNGYITVEDLKSIFNEFGESYDEEYLKEMIIILDKNNNNYLDFEDFKEVIRNSKTL